MAQRISQKMSQTFPSPPSVSTQNLPAKPQTPPNNTRLNVIGMLDPVIAERWNINQAINRTIKMPKNILVDAIK
jgi:hypothetical protein